MWGRGVRFIGKVFLACATPVIIAATLPTSSYADDAPVVIEEITVSARSRDENLQSVPDSISVFTETTIESFGIDDYFDLIRTTPGLSIVEASQSPGIVLLNVRGIGQQLNQDPPIAVIVDGVQVASPAAITQA
jgi:iron complex outermembrane receptor protein